ncbi:MAG TPA: Hint domain-containing protein [Rhodobacteraceae bacterium]|nr:Hint domain-containing protein [Paracoccaceae bacterium]
MSGSYYIYSLADLGIPETAIPAPGDTFTTSATPDPDFINIFDDDPLLNEVTYVGGLPTIDFNQVLASDLIIDGALVGSAGDLVVSDGGSAGFLTTSGDVITGYLIIIIDPVTGIGEAVGMVTTVPVPPNTDYTYTGVSTSGPVPYADLAQCFTLGTKILCQNGEIPVQDIQAGDLVQTRDHGLQPVRWIGQQKVSGRGALAPILVKAGVLGNTVDIRVSPMHRMLVEGARTEAMFGNPEMWAHAKDLCCDDRIYRAPVDEVVYVHVLFDKHEIINAHGCWSESFAPHQEVLGVLDEKTRNEILALFPQPEGEWMDARPSLTACEASALVHFQ